MPASTRSFAIIFAPRFVVENTKADSIDSSLSKCLSRDLFCFLRTWYTSCVIVSTVDETGVTSTLIGSFTIESTSFVISDGMVAENNKFCLTLGNFDIIFLTSWIIPISSIRSASSKTKHSMLRKSIYFWLNKSSILPGVAISISTPSLSAFVWGFCDTPPKITALLRFIYLP